ncbi:MAG: hypothetical protein JNM47_07585 [Hyphomonadaceae bacterium]|nr:hypothetical protein [Hyphomonadaceae bacterium]
MRATLVAIVSAFALFACSAPEQSDRTSEPPPPAAEEPATPAPETPPSPTDVAPPPAPDPGVAEPPRAEAPAPVESAPSVTTRSLRVVATPVIVEINRDQARNPANGGSSVVLFTEGAANTYRNTVTCLNIWNLMDTATTQEVRVGLRKADDGTVEALRPMYWLNQSPTTAAEPSCSERLSRYDYARARTIKDKYGLTGAGPYFLVARADERMAALIDLSGRTDREVADLVRYFRDGFAFQNDIWDPSRADPSKKREALTAFFGSRFRETLVAALGFVSAPTARAGCRLGDLKDAPCT